jgi:hypothetical protein
MAEWWKYDGPEAEQDDELEGLEKQALDAVLAISRHADTQPDKVLIIGAALRKISTIAGSHAQTINLRSMTMKRKVQA